MLPTNQCEWTSLVTTPVVHWKLHGFPISELKLFTLNSEYLVCSRESPSQLKSNLSFVLER